MGFFDHKHEKESPIGNLRAHIGTFMYFVKVGKSKFKNKGRVGEIFADMDNTVSFPAGYIWNDVRYEKKTGLCFVGCSCP